MLAADSQALEITEVSSYHLNEKSLSSFFHVVFLTACLTSPQIRFKKLPRGLVLFTLFLFFFIPASYSEGRSKVNLLISTLKDSIRADKCHLPWEYWTMTLQIG